MVYPGRILGKQGSSAMGEYLLFLWPIPVFAFLGSFIDFYIGKKGQERARDFLLTWWVRFDDIRWGNFGPKEAEATSSIIESWFGTHLLSLKRIVRATLVYAHSS
jgi:hypothetical protein